MDLLGYFKQKTGDAGRPYQKGSRRPRGRRAPALLLVWLCAPQGQTLEPFTKVGNEQAFQEDCLDMGKKKSEIVPGGVAEYIAKCPKDVQGALKGIRAAIHAATPKAMETVSYFRFPGYHLTRSTRSGQGGDYAYNGMAVWFSYKKPFVRLHIWPAAIKAHKKELARYKTSVGAIYFPDDKKIPSVLVKKLVKESIKVMKVVSKKK